MEQKIRRLKQALQREMPHRGRGRRFPSSLVAEAVSISREVQAADWSLSDLARDLGLGVATLKRWCDREQEAERYPAVMQPVTVMAPTWSTDTSGLVVYGPAALRIEGLGLDDLVLLWRKLS
jgi:hypothetical protein